MRLAAFKAHGFKSFAEPVSFKVGGELIGIVGPNGCGKSNIVDAVRWLLGESKASSLRGNTLADVMFNGSQKRDPADWCAVEACFTNARQGNGGGMWAAYPEIIIRRELSRDGRQSYTINGTQVRRRDVVDLFRGTGVAPRAYGVVEQGMVTDIAEASPEELRTFMEEAAGVSHYKERRRDSERRLAASNENLAQMTLILQDLRKRMEALKRQARTARRHRQLGEEIDRLNALLLMSRRTAVAAELAASRQRLRQLDDNTQKLQGKIAALREQGERKKEERNTLQTQMEVVLARMGEAQKALAAAEHDAENAAQGKSVAVARREEAKQELQTLAGQLTQLQQEEKQLQQQQAAVQKETEKNAGSAEVEASELARLQVEREAVQVEVDEAREQLGQRQRRLEAETVRRQMLTERLADIDKRLAAAETAGAQLPLKEETNEDLSREKQQLEEAAVALAAARQACEQGAAAAAAADAAVRQLENEIAKLAAEMETLGAMLEEDGWREGRQRLAHVLQVDAGEWSRALDAALGMYAAAVAVADIAAFINENDLPPPGTAVVDLHPQAAEVAQNNTGLPLLIEKLQMPAERRQVLEYWLTSVYAAEDEAAAAAARTRLAPNQTIVTRSGAVYGAHSLLMTGETRGGYNWQQRMQTLQTEAAKRRRLLAEEKSTYESAKQRQQEADAESERCMRRLNEAQQALAERRIEINRRLEQQRAAKQWREELEQGRQQLQDEKEQLAGEQAGLVAALEEQHEQHAVLQAAFERQKSRLDNANAALESYRTAVQEAGMKRRDLQRQGEELSRRFDDIKERTRDNSERQQLMLKRLETFDSEVEKYDESVLQKKLASSRTRHAACEEEIAACRRRQQEAEHAAGRMEEQREEMRTEIERRQQQQADERVAENTLVTQVNYLSDSLEELALSAEQQEEIKAQQEDGDAAAWQAAMEELRGKRDRLGAINFMAVSELHECEIKISELDRQKSDVETAIAELQSAIQRIDRETQTRLRQMFDAVNKEFSILYKQMFGGGEARLEMVGEAILDAGFELKVRLPGKRLFPVRMLSGGEKAAAAVTFIFAILRLNPPPFCILDEVDAPLDDHRSQRFVQLLGDISQAVQCLVVTHNKNTISSLPRLIGVTQEEPGTSKVVSVTLRDALRAAGQ